MKNDPFNSAAAAPASFSAPAISAAGARLAVLAAGVVSALVPAAAAAQPAPSEPGRLHVFFGTYTRGASEGIYRCELDLATGVASEPALAAESDNPSFLALRPDGRALYAVNEVGTFGGESTGAVSAFALDPASGALTPLNQAPSSGGAPCHLVVDRAGQHVLVANYSGGNVAALALGKDGRLGERTGFVQHAGSSVNPRRQKGPHAHSINLDPAGRFAFAADLGTDKVYIFAFGADGTLSPHDPPAAALEPGAGPRHFAFRPDGRFAYVINELHCTVTAFAYDAAAGRLEAVQTITTLPHEHRRGYSTAEVQVHPSGRFVYGSNRGHDSIVVYACDPATGRLTRVENEPTGGKTPRNFGIDPGGRYLLAANQSSDTVVLFRIDPDDGSLQPTGQVLKVPTPVCVKFLPVVRRP